MNEIQRFAVPALLAFLLHGILANFTIQKNSMSVPKISGIPISININSLPPDPSPNDQQVIEKKEIKPKSLPREAIVKQTERTPIPTIEPLQRKKFHKPAETITHSAVPNEVKTTIGERVAPKEVLIHEAEKNIRPPEVINKMAADAPPHEKSPPAPVQKKAIPVYRQNEQPQYPLIAKRRGYQGEVRLNVLVDWQGIVSEVRIKTTSGHSSLDKAALAAVRRWRFIPATIDGNPVDMWVDVPIDFRLQ